MEQSIARAVCVGPEAGVYEDPEREGGACPICRSPARLLTCWECCETTWAIECGHRFGAAEPAMRRGRSDGSDRHRVFCTECAEG